VLTEQLELAWAGAVLPEFLSERLAALTRRHLVEKGYLRARADVEVTRVDAAMQRALVRVTQGPLTTVRRLAFSGNTVITARELEALAEPFLEIEAWIDPAALEEAIHAEYEVRGYAAAVARSGQPAFAERTVTLPVTIEEGPQGRLRTLSLRGISSPDETDARAVLGLAAGSPLTPDAVRQARLRLERHYRTGGFRDARVTASARVEGSTGWTDVTMDVARGSLYTVRHVSIQGAQTTKESLVRSAVTLAPGSVASPAAIGETERRLYDIGVFRAAAVRLEPISEAGADAAETPVDAVVTVEESRRYQLRFGIEANTEYQPAVADRTNGAGLALDLRDRNFLGQALSLGIGMRYERSLQSFRALFAVPRLGSRPVRTNVYGVWRREQDDTPSGLTLRDDSTEFIVEQRWQPRRAVEVAWGYSLEWQDVRLVAPEERTPRGFDGVLASLYGTVTIDRRDSALDATRGWFQSASVQWGLRALGSTLDYLRLHLRSSYYQPVGPVVLASAVRVGSIVSWDGRPGPNVEDLFFKAGGTQSVRGYAQDTLSAVDFLGIPFGGTRVLVLNQEARFPLFWRLAGVVFADAGNTFLPENADLGDLRVGAGFGLRIRTPLAPLRLDLAWPVPADESQRGPRWHFSIGQMF
jgi:outer membrane protein assembly factor BamA